MDKSKLLEQLVNDEGFKPYAYKDHLGYWTIGIGRLIDKEKGGGITEAEARYLLNNDVDRVVVALSDKLPWFKGLSDGRQHALINMAFQMGIGYPPANGKQGSGLLGFQYTLEMMRLGRYNEAADNALKSKWAEQTPERARRVTDLIRKG